MQFLFYDLETSGISAKWQRIMQFGARRTDENLQPIGEPIEQLITLTEEILPEPGAVLITGITPQQTRRDGVSEAEFWRQVYPVLTEGQTCIMGFNSIRFDDEFLRYSLWRNFRDPYAWAWERNNSRWDLLDVIRMTRALRPEGIDWPVDEDGAPTNRLELLASANNLVHNKAHSALSDVDATIALAQLLQKNQPKLWQWCFDLRLKKVVEAFIKEQDGVFLYTSGRYPKERMHTAPVVAVGPTQRRDGMWVYDLTIDPDIWLDRSDEELKVAFELGERMPLKAMQFNRAPAVAPLNVLDDKASTRLGIDMAVVESNLKKLKKHDIFEFLDHALLMRESKYPTREPINDPDGQLYDGFVSDQERQEAARIVIATKSELAEMIPQLEDPRLKELFVRYKARNWPELLKQTEQLQWDAYRQGRLKADYGMNLERYYKELENLGHNPDLSATQKSLLTELKLWAESIMPIDD